ncbi:DUF6011 domain-containing protein [Bacillus mesophilum]|uniref:DUF6011 domain-containing protein n=1 Tax=Bacillus mesophilum TaxID=1071718 RepID=UPI00137595A3|nr:DUF6011 domain-containing protein [Bacillus mesophilum]
MNCPMCNRPLKSAKSISAGIGPVCARKLSELQDTADEDQLKMELDTNAKNVLPRIQKA